jgi:predicted O-methyltransferase YrrM
VASLSHRLKRRLGRALGLGDASARGLEILAGTPHARYATPLDYPPSRAYRPRWGFYGRAPLAWMGPWLDARRPAFEGVIDAMNDTVAGLGPIAETHADAAQGAPCWYGVPYTPFDSIVLCTMLRRYRPAMYLEIGSGVSTCFARHAIERFGLHTQIVSIDPAPRQEIDGLCDRVERCSLEEMDLAIFSSLQPGDIVFMDGSHRAFMNSDVAVFFGDVMARLAPGVIVQIHDVFLPYDYPEECKPWYWNEQYLLMSLLLGARDKVEPLAPTFHICLSGEIMARFVPPSDVGRRDGFQFGGAFWFTLTQALS